MAAMSWKNRVFLAMERGICYNKKVKESIKENDYGENYKLYH